MASLNELTEAIDKLLGLAAVGHALQINSSKREKAFEVYTLALIAKALKRAGGKFEIMGINSGNSPNPVVFRAAPGAIYSTSQNFSYLECRLNGKHFEVHVDVEFEGVSSATHELDVSIIEYSHADRSRRGFRNPRYPLLTIECKFYSKSTPSIGLARGLVGLVADFQLKMGCAFVSNAATTNLKSYLSQKNRPDPFIDLSPNDARSEERFISHFENKLRKWASV